MITVFSLRYFAILWRLLSHGTIRIVILGLSLDRPTEEIVRMGLFSFMKSRYIDLIEWTDIPTRMIVHQFSSSNQYIKMGATLIVRESQVAVIVNEGKVADVFEPGKYSLSRTNLSILSAQRLWKAGFKSPFKVDIYYVTTKQFTDLNWETVNPIIVKSDDFGDVGTKATGTFAFRVMNADKFMKGIFGANQIYDTSYIIGQLKSKLIVGLTHLMNTTKVTVQDFNSQYDELSESAENKLQEQFAQHGLELCSFIIESIHLPDHLKSRIIRDEVAGITEFADEITKAETLQESKLTKCHECGQPMTAAMKFCSDCGAGAKQEYPCSCGNLLNSTMKYCPDCGVKVQT